MRKFVPGWSPKDFSDGRLADGCPASYGKALRSGRDHSAGLTPEVAEGTTAKDIVTALLERQYKAPRRADLAERKARNVPNEFGEPIFRPRENFCWKKSKCGRGCERTCQLV